MPDFPECRECQKNLLLYGGSFHVVGADSRSPATHPNPTDVVVYRVTCEEARSLASPELLAEVQAETRSERVHDQIDAAFARADQLLAPYRRLTALGAWTLNWDDVPGDVQTAVHNLTGFPLRNNVPRVP